jgi:xanthine dehydrogenase YagR molybdenum-binding subunit
MGSDARAVVITAMQDIGTGTRTTMAQIAAEELGFRSSASTVALGDSARGPYAAISAGSSTTPSMGPAVRAAAADVGRRSSRSRPSATTGRSACCRSRAARRLADGGSWPIEEVVGLLDDAQILGKGARGPNPTGMQVLTFGVQVAEVAVDVETGEVRVERVAAIHDVGRVINPLAHRARSRAASSRRRPHALGGPAARPGDRDGA